MRKVIVSRFRRDLHTRSFEAQCSSLRWRVGVRSLTVRPFRDAGGFQHPRSHEETTAALAERGLRVVESSHDRGLRSEAQSCQIVNREDGRRAEELHRGAGCRLVHAVAGPRRRASGGRAGDQPVQFRLSLNTMRSYTHAWHGVCLFGWSCLHRRPRRSSQLFTATPLLAGRASRADLTTS